jgi:hypothetical protein
MMFFVTGETQFGLGGVTDALKSNLTGIQLMVENIDEQFGKMANTIGFGREQAFLLKQTLTEGLTEVTRLGGNLEKIVAQQTALFETFGTQIILNKNATDELFATTQATGIETKTLFEGYVNLGKSIYSANEEMATIMESADLIGVNAQTVTKLVGANLKELSRFNFKDGVIGLADMAAKSSMLRGDMTAALETAKSLYQPEQAQEFVNKLSRLGIVQSELMDVERVRFLSRNDPEKLQEEIAKIASTFVDETGKMSAVGMDFMDELAKGTSFNANQLSEMGIAFKEMQDKQKIINETGLKGLIPDEKEMQKLENILIKGKDGRFEVTYKEDGQQVTKAIQDMSQTEQQKLADFLKTQNDQIEKTFEAKPGEDKDLKGLIEQQMGISEKVANSLAALSTVIPSQIAGSERGEKIIETMANTQDKIATTALESLDKLTDDAGKMIELKLSYLDKVGKNIEDKMPTIISGVEEYGDKIITEMQNLIDTLDTNLNSLITKLGDFTGSIKKFFGVADDFVSFPGDNRMLLGEEGAIRINPKDTIIGSTEFPQTKDDFDKFMEGMKSPQNPYVSAPVETISPINLETLKSMGLKNEELTSIMMQPNPINTTPSEIKTSTDINHKLDIMVDLKNVPTGTDKEMLKSTIESVVLKDEFVNNIKTVLNRIKGFNYQ